MMSKKVSVKIKNEKHLWADFIEYKEEKEDE